MKSFRLFLILSICLIFTYGSETEIISKRTFTSKTYSLDNGQLKQVIYPFPIHYKEQGQYIQIPENNQKDYYMNLALQQQKNGDKKILSINSINSSIGDSPDGNYVVHDPNDQLFPYYIYTDGTPWVGKQSSGSSSRINNYWSIGPLDTDYIVDSTVYSITMSEAVIPSGNSLTLYWMGIGTYLSFSDAQDLWKKIGDATQLGSITLNSSFTSSQTRTITWDEGIGISDSVQYNLDNNHQYFPFHAGLKSNQESSENSYYVNVSLQNLTIYYTPPKKTVNVDNTIYNTSTSIGGELEIVGTLPQETISLNNAGNDIVLYQDSSYVISEPEDVITYNSVDYTHHSWKENTNEYELDHDFSVDKLTDEQVGWFKELKSVTISKQYGDGSIMIKDPWWKDPATNQGHNPPIYQTLSGSSYDVFLDQNDQFNPEIPIYSLKAPHIGEVTGSDIYVFDHWEASIIDGDTSAVFNLRGDITTKNRETDVVFKQAGATVTAVYEPVNQIANYTLNIPTDETMNIPAGANISFAEAFTFNVKGEISAIGTDASPIELIPASSDLSFEW
jgi:hypothetical protein